MRCWTVLALLVAVCAVFLGVGHVHTEETPDDIREVTALEDVENDKDLPDSFENTESEDDDGDDEEEPGAAGEESDGNTLTETENALESVNETPSNDEDETALFKRTPWWRRRRRRRRRFFRRIRLRRIADKFCKYARYHPKFAWKCHLYRRFGDEESPGSKNKKQT